MDVLVHIKLNRRKLGIGDVVFIGWWPFPHSSTFGVMGSFWPL